ncbi:MAG: 5'-nucleotidase C-terminal domain-containing protein [Burkholderiales bacterium]|nr:5'-nucleotidase C-terminal domain-containing protein [Bacteroidia bacterium]
MKFHLKILFFSALISLYACSKKTTVTNISESHIIVNNNKIDSSVFKVMAPYKKTHDEQMYAVIAKSEDALIKADVESTLGNFFCDAVIFETKKLLGKDSAMLDVAIFNKGGLRNSLPKGNITIGNVFELMPFDNEVVLLKLSGTQFKDMCYKIVEKGGIPIGGMRLTMKGTTPTDIIVKGKPFDETQDYWVVTSDYLANGGDSYNFFKNAKERKVTKVLLRNMIINYCEDITKLEQTIKPKLDGRIQLSK